MGALVDDEAPGLHGVGGEGTCHRAARGEERHVDVGENAGFGLLHGVFTARVLDHLAGRPRRGEKPQRGQRELAVVQELEELLTDGAGGADDPDIDGC